MASHRILAPLSMSLGVTLAAAACGGSDRDRITWAIHTNDVSEVEALVRRERSPDAAVARRWSGELSALMLAAEKGRVDVVERLLAIGADPNRANESGYTALTFACLERRDVVVRMLLAKGADPRRSTNEGETCQLAVHRKLEVDPGEAKIVTALGEARVGLDILARGPSSWRPDAHVLHRLARTAKLDVLDAYLSQGVAVDRRDDSGATLLMLAARRNARPAIRLLLQRGADPRAVDSSGLGVVDGARSSAERPTLAVLEAVVDPSLSAPEQRVAAFDAAQAKWEKEEKAAAAARAAKAEAERRSRREREAAAAQARPRAPAQSATKPSKPSGSSQPPPSSTVPWSAGWAPAPAPTVKSACDEDPALRACAASGRSCRDCYYAMIHDNVRRSGGGRTEASCSSGYTPCGGVCCGSGYVCCVGATSASSAETCRPVSVGCKQGWDAERRK